MFQCSGWSINEVKNIVVLFLYAKKNGRTANKLANGKHQ
jgi:hypothetical protein